MKKGPIRRQKRRGNQLDLGEVSGAICPSTRTQRRFMDKSYCTSDALQDEEHSQKSTLSTGGGKKNLKTSNPMDSGFQAISPKNSYPKFSEQGSQTNPLHSSPTRSLARLSARSFASLASAVCPRNNTRRSHGNGQPPVHGMDRSAEKEVFQIQYP